MAQGHGAAVDVHLFRREFQGLEERAGLGGEKQESLQPSTTAASPASPPSVDQEPLLGPLVRAVAVSRRARRPLSLLLAELSAALTLPEEVKMTVDVDPVDLM